MSVNIVSRKSGLSVFGEVMKKATIMLVFLSWAAKADAIVNIEAMRQDKAEDGVNGHVELSVRGVSGNTKKSGAQAGGRLQWRKGDLTHFAILRYAYGEGAGRRDTNKTFFHGRHIRHQTAWRADELFVQAEKDEFARLSFRGLVGAGERFTLIQSPKKQRAFLGAGVYYASEKLESKTGTTDGGTDRFWRFSTYLSYSQKLNTQVRFISTTYYQPSFTAFSDYRLLEEAALGVKMSDRLSLKLSLNVVHDSRPPQTVKKTDVIYATGLEFQF